MAEAPEKIWAWALDKFNGKPFWAGDIKVSHVPKDGATKYRRADIPAKVKGLVWDRLGDVFYANGAGQEYSFNLQDMADGSGFNIYLGSMPLTDAEYHTPDDAKAAAQAHYEALVLSCLEGAGIERLRNLEK